MKGNFILLEIKFSFSDWENKTVQTFRDEIKSFIGLNNTRSSLVLSNDINENGITFYFLTTNPEFGGQVQAKFRMSSFVDDIDLKNFSIEYGNSELIL